MLTKNHIIDAFLIRDKSISHDEHKILFQDKDYWNNNSISKIDFNDVLSKIIKLQTQQDTIYLSNIYFPYDIEFADLKISSTININFAYCVFEGKVNFYGIHFQGNIDFSYATFYKDIDFRKTMFTIETSFIKCNFLSKTVFDSSCFKEKVDFRGSEFKDISFQHCIFEKKSYFGNCLFLGITSFLNSRFQKNIDFDKSIFDGALVSFANCIFYSLDFSHSSFQGEVSFIGINCATTSSFDSVIFYRKVDFSQSKFDDNVSFENTQFESAYFFNTEFNKIISFKNAISDKIISFEHMSCGTLDMTNSNFAIVNFLDIKGIGFDTFKKIHLGNKETARIIKSHLEKQHNIIEANKFFVFEQEKYYDELSWFKSPGNKFVVGLNKIVSNHQTNWLQVLLWIILFSLFVLVVHDGMPPLAKEAIYKIPNRAIELINPLNIFKKDYDLYKNHEFLAMFIRVIVIYLFWQFTVSFRQNTRRK